MLLERAKLMIGTGLAHWTRRAALTVAPLLVLAAAAAPAHAAVAQPAALAGPGGWWHHQQAAEFTAPDGQDNAFYGSTVAISATARPSRARPTCTHRRAVPGRW
jgi:hypothetical protein